MNASASRPTILRLGTAVLAAVIVLALVFMAGVPAIQTASAAKSTPNVKILGKRILKQGATPGGNANNLLTIGTLVHRSICTDQGGGTYRLEVQIKSGKGGGKLLSRNGVTNLTSKFQQAWFVFGDGQNGFSEGYDVLYKDGTFRHFQIDLFVHGLGNNCVTRIVATNA